MSMAQSKASGRGLEVVNLWLNRGQSPVLQGVSLEVGPGEIVALLGANGAGKSSLLSAISGVLPASHGDIRVDGRPLDALSVEQRASLISHVPEGRHLFTQHTVNENLELGAWPTSPVDRASRAEIVRGAFPELEELKNLPAASLSGGQQQMVALGRGLMAPGIIIMVDELSLGLAPKVAGRFAATLQDLRDSGFGVLLVEQYVHLAMSVCDRAIVLARGRIVLEGSAADMPRDARSLHAAYFGFDESGEEAVPIVAAVSPSELQHRFIRDRASIVLALGGAVATLVAMALPWFSYSEFGSNGGNVRAYETSGGWWLAALLSALLVIKSSLRYSFADERSKRWDPYVMLGAGIALVATIFVLTWAFDANLPSAELRIYSRSLGLLIALHTSVLALVGALRIASIEMASWRTKVPEV